jgi:hypothetical protein
MHIVEDLKSSLYAQLNSVFMDFMELYARMKDQVVRMRENRRRIVENIARDDPEPRPTKSQTIITNNISNINLLTEISRDEDYFRSHRMYEELSNAYNEVIGPIMNDVQNILTIRNEIQFYHDDLCN